jgi:bacillopeptidase F
MKKKLWKIYICIFLTIYAVSSSQAGPIAQRLKSRLQTQSPEDEIAVIITLADQLDTSSFKKINNGLFKAATKSLSRAGINKALRAKAEITQRPLKNFLKRKGAQKIVPFWIFNGIAVTIKAKNISELAQQPGIQSVRLDSILSLPVTMAGSSTTPEWNLDAINAPTLWAKGYTGAGTVVANMDTGVDILHPDLASRWRGGSNSWFDPHNEHPSPHDSNGHGTQTMGIMVGGDADGTAIGVAPGASWIAVKMYNDAGQALLSHIHSGFQWLLDPDGDPNTDDLPDVVNGSWGYNDKVNECFDEFITDIAALKAAGVAVVFAAGNSGPNASTSVSPANYAESFAVGNVDEQLLIDFSSSRGPSICDNTIFPEIVAPGINIKTADLTFNGTLPYSYAFVSGTSFSAPHVSGAMALLLSANPQLSIAELENAIASSSNDLGAAGPDNDYGNGLLDIAASYNTFASFPWILFMPAIIR